jgi:hypothetical protein
MEKLSLHPFIAISGIRGSVLIKKALNNFMTKFMNILDLQITLFEKTVIPNKTKTNILLGRYNAKYEMLIV